MNYLINAGDGRKSLARSATYKLVEILPFAIIQTGVFFAGTAFSANHLWALVPAALILNVVVTQK